MMSMGSQRIVALGIVVLTLSTCGKDKGTGGTRMTPTIPAAPREAPPPGVAEQVSYFEIGDGGCPGAVAPSVRFLGGFPIEGETEIAYPALRICPVGFSAQRPIDVIVRRPDAREIRRTVPAGRNQVRWVSWLPLPGDPLGRYTVAAGQGPKESASSFTVHAASRPRLVAVEGAAHRPVAPGGSVHIAFAGFRRRAAVTLNVYRKVNRNSTRYVYVTSLTARMDQDGQRVRTVRVDRRSPAAKYLARVSEQVQYPFDVRP
jgi:hypothetical protein